MNLVNQRPQKYIDLSKLQMMKRQALFTAAEKVLMDEMPVIPIDYKTMEFSEKPPLTGVVISEGDVDFKFAHFSQ